MNINAKLRPETQLDKYISSWQGCQFWNQTFEQDDWGFEVDEIREMLDEPNETAQ